MPALTRGFAQLIGKVTWLVRIDPCYMPHLPFLWASLSIAGCVFFLFPLCELAASFPTSVASLGSCPLGWKEKKKKGQRLLLGQLTARLPARSIQMGLVSFKWVSQAQTWGPVGWGLLGLINKQGSRPDRVPPCPIRPMYHLWKPLEILWLCSRLTIDLNHRFVDLQPKKQKEKLSSEPTRLVMWFRTMVTMGLQT